MRKLILLIASVLLWVSVDAQIISERGKDSTNLVSEDTQVVSGVVKDTANVAIEFANVILYELPDTTYIRGTITDVNGVFELESPLHKDLLLEVSSVGYNTQRTTPKSNQTIILTNDGIRINEVVVNKSRPIAKLTATGVLTSVEHTILSDMGTGNEVLKRIPMVKGDKGEFEVFGRGKAKIYINNREVRDPAEIDQLNSTEIKDIEVIRNPGAKYDATVLAVIKIRTLRKQGDGFGFNLRSSYYRSKKNTFIEQLHMNYRKGKFDISAAISYTNREGLEIGTFQHNAYVDTLWSQNINSNAQIHDNNLNARIGLNYEINQNHSIGVRYDIRTSPQQNIINTSVKSTVTANNEYFDEWDNQANYRTINYPVSQANLYYAGKVEKLSIDFNTDLYIGSTVSETKQSEKSKKYGEREISSKNNVDNTLVSSKLQLSYPIWKGDFSLGGEYVNIRRKDKYTNEPLVDFSSEVGIEESNLAAFVGYALHTKIGNFNAGVRYENVDTKYALDQTVSKDKSKKYDQFFPHFSYAIDIQEVGLQLNYSTQVARPTYRQLSNNLMYINRFTQEQGNPMLDPAINRELSLMSTWKFLQASVSYKYEQDAIIYIANQSKREPKVSIMSYENIKKLPSLSAFMAIAPRFGFWHPQLSAGITKQWLTVSSNGLDIVLDKPLFDVSFHNVFALPKQFLVTLDFLYRSKGNFQNSYIHKDQYILDFSIAKSFLNNSLSLKLNFNDILNQQVFAFKTYSPKMDLTKTAKRDNRHVSITLRYNFNVAKSKYKGDSSNSEAVRRL